MKLKRYLVVILAISLTSLLAFIGSHYILGQENILSYPKYPVSYLETEYNKPISYDLIDRYELINSEPERLYSGLRHKSYKLQNKHSTKVNIIEIDASETKNVKNMLEKFLIETHGVASIFQHREFKVNEYEAYQIVYNLHNDSQGRYYTMFTGIRFGDIGIVFTFNYLAKVTEIDLFDEIIDYDQHIYNKILNNTLIKKISPEVKKQLKQKEKKEINPEFIRLQKSINKDFNSTL